MKKGQIFRGIGIILIIIGLVLIFSTLTNYSYLVTLFRALGLQRPSEVAYKFSLMVDPLKPAILIISTGMLIAGGISVKQQK